MISFTVFVIKMSFYLKSRFARKQTYQHVNMQFQSENNNNNHLKITESIVISLINTFVKIGRYIQKHQIKNLAD